MEHMGIPRETARERSPPQQQQPLPEVPNARSALQARRPNRVQPGNQGRSLSVGMNIFQDIFSKSFHSGSFQAKAGVFRKGNLSSTETGTRQGWANYAFDWGFYLLLLPVTVPYRIATTAFSGFYNIVAYFFGLPMLPGGPTPRRPPIGRDRFLQHVPRYYSFCNG